MKRKTPATYAEALAGKAKNTFSFDEKKVYKKKPKPKPYIEPESLRLYKLQRDAEF